METKFPSNSARGRAGEERVGADARGPKVSEKKEGEREGARAGGLVAGPEELGRGKEPGRGKAGPRGVGYRVLSPFFSFFFILFFKALFK